MVSTKISFCLQSKKSTWCRFKLISNQLEIIKEISEHLDIIKTNVDEMVEARKKANTIEDKTMKHSIFAPHLVVGPEEPAPITILNLFLYSCFILFNLSLFTKKRVSVGQFLIVRKSSVNFFAAFTKCKFFFLKEL